MTDESCIFCAIVSGHAPARVLSRDTDTMTILDIAPATRGHVLVIPVEHHATLFETPPELAGRLMVAGQQAMEQLNASLHPDGFTFALMVNPAGWQTVFHVHLHVLPRYRDDALVPPWVERRASDEELDEVFRSIRS